MRLGCPSNKWNLYCYVVKVTFFVNQMKHYTYFLFAQISRLYRKYQQVLYVFKVYFISFISKFEEDFNLLL